MVCVPVLSDAVSVATPLTRGVVWMGSPLVSVKVTVPVGIAPLPFETETVAWKVKAVPKVAVGLAALFGVNVVVVGVGLMLNESVLLVAGRLLVSVG